METAKIQKKTILAIVSLSADDQSDNESKGAEEKIKKKIQNSKFLTRRFFHPIGINSSSSSSNTRFSRIIVYKKKI